MKKSYILLIALFLLSCKKDQEISDLKKTIAGTWEYETFSGYPFNSPALPPGNGKIIVIGEDGSFKRMQHDTLLFSGSYALSKKKDCHPGNSNIVFSTNEDPSGDYRYIDVADGKLTLSTPNCYQDGGTAYYRRIE
ncbi:MAG TPA: hypothetical protein VL095_11110 [Flavisolibacter sp.]|nr:hypothetical protein [Flavisolibacter sp.]